MNLGLHQTLHHAVDKGTTPMSRRAEPEFPVHRPAFFLPRGLALHRKTFGRDMYKYPVNLVWGLPVALVTGTADPGRGGAHRTAQWLHRIQGMATACTRNSNG